MIRRVLLLLLACASWLCCVPGYAAERGIVVVTSAQSADYAQAIAALGGALERGGLPRSALSVITAADFQARPPAAPALWIALGSEAARVLTEAGDPAPRLYALLPRASFEWIVAQAGRKAPRKISAIYLDQPFSRQLDLLHLALPNAKRIGVLWGPGSAMLAPALAAAAAARGLQIFSATLKPGQPIYPSLARVLDHSDALLAVADPLVYNGNTIENILLASFHARVPLVAFSPAYVRAGALLALYSTPAQIGAQAGRIALAVLRGGQLPSPQYPAQFSVATNRHVALALEINLDEAALATHLQQRAP